MLKDPMLTLRMPTVSDGASFKAAAAEFKSIDPDWDFAFHFDEATDFRAYIQRLNAWSRGDDLPSTFVPNTFLVGVAGGTIIGRVSIRHVLNDFLQRIGGHIGFGVVPSQRRKGYAWEMLRQTIPIAANLGIKRILITCDDDNVGSYRVIEANGGVLENKIVEPNLAVAKRRYWILTDGLSL